MVLKPVDDDSSQIVPISPRLDQLAGMASGFIDDGLSTSHEFLQRISALFEAEYGVRNAVFTRNPSSHSVVPKPVYDQVLSQCDFVICGVGV